MTVENVDQFEAALAAADAQTNDAVIETVIADEVVGSVEAISAIEDEVALEVSEEAELEEENDENAEFRRALRTASGDWFVVHSYAGYEKKVKGILANRIT